MHPSSPAEDMPRRGQPPDTGSSGSRDRAAVVQPRNAIVDPLRRPIIADCRMISVRPSPGWRRGLDSILGARADRRGGAADRARRSGAVLAAGDCAAAGEDEVTRRWPCFSPDECEPRAEFSRRPLRDDRLHRHSVTKLVNRKGIPSRPHHLHRL